jgi:hypothetical protein
VSDETGPSEFEMIAQYSFDDRDRDFILRSDFKSEVLRMSLEIEPVHQVQTVFGGTRCAFEVKRSKETDIDVYSSSLKNCGPDAGFEAYPYFKVRINKERIPFSSGPNSREYVDFSENILNDHGPKVTVNKLTMMEENAQLDSIYFYVAVLDVQAEQNICETLQWNSRII